MSHLAAPAPPDVERPAAVLALAAGRATEALWRNEVGGLTFRVGGGPDGADDGEAVVVKWNPVGSGESLAEEARRMRWLGGRFPAPEVVGSGDDASGEWLATRAIDARSAVASPWRERPDVAVHAIAEGLRRLHEGLDPATCPFDWSVGQRLAKARAEGHPIPEELAAPLPVDRLVVCHGDPCAPNTLIDDDGAFRAIVDVGRLGVADRWADLAVASMSLEWNYGSSFEPLFFEAYGIEPDPVRVAYYRALWNTT